MSELRHDRSALASPRHEVSSMVLEGHVARTGGLAHPDRPHGVEYISAQELGRIVDQLPGLPVTLQHPDGLVSSRTRVIGRVERAWLDGEHAAASIRITDSAAIAAIDQGTKELSLGMLTDLVRADDGNHYRTNIELDHLAIVDTARCGSTCALRTDEGATNMSNRQTLLTSLAAHGLRADHITGNGTRLDSRDDAYLEARLRIAAEERNDRGVRVDAACGCSGSHDETHDNGARADASIAESKRERANMIARNAGAREANLKRYGKGVRGDAAASVAPVNFNPADVGASTVEETPGRARDEGTDAGTSESQKARQVMIDRNAKAREENLRKHGKGGV